ncbi:hypothetical protein niasHT_029603 [Heterodera trifolii]|uniref:Abnormal cell migration protein 18-like fibronectin type I domain-containing protein n=1 Tax=Heterodera trifolii TaxID=157864 RepID=A0ABD2K340_9BILA
MFFITFFANFCFCLALPSSQANVRELGQRYQALKEYVVSKKQNVRYEATATQMAPKRKPTMGGGNATTAKFPPGIDMPTNNSECVDMNGKRRSHGAGYERHNRHIIYRCNNQMEEAIACFGIERTGKARIPIGQTVQNDGYWHKCEKYANGSVTYTQGCYFYEGNKLHKMNLNEQQRIGLITHFCEEESKDMVQYYTRRVDQCIKNGRKFEDGEKFNENHIRYKCQSGIIGVLGCFIDEIHILAIGQDFLEPNRVHRCYRAGITVGYTSYDCGFRGGPSCKSPLIPRSLGKVPKLRKKRQLTPRLIATHECGHVIGYWNHPHSDGVISTTTDQHEHGAGLTSVPSRSHFTLPQLAAKLVGLLGGPIFEEQFLGVSVLGPTDDSWARKVAFQMARMEADGTATAFFIVSSAPIIEEAHLRERAEELLQGARTTLINWLTIRANRKASKKCINQLARRGSLGEPEIRRILGTPAYQG